MKKVLILILCNYCSTLLVGQNSFEGIATYQLEYINPNPKRVSDSIFYVRMKQLLKVKEHSIQKCYYKTDKYLSNTDALNQLYHPLEKKLYSWVPSTDTATWVWTESNIDSIRFITELEDTEEVQDVPCKKLRIVSKYGQTTYWYHPDKFKISYDFFKSHQYGNWSEYLKIAGALPIKYEIKNKIFFLVATAVTIKETKLLDSVFELPSFKFLAPPKDY